MKLRNIMKAVRSILRPMERECYEVCSILFGYQVYNTEYSSVHYTLTWNEALEWMSCYAVDSKTSICRASLLLCSR